MEEQNICTIIDLDRQFDKEIKSTCIFQRSPNKLYHYTTLEGLKGIAESKKCGLLELMH